MNPIIVNYLSELQLGELQIFKNMGVIPLFTTGNGGPEYVTLKEALTKKLLIVTEIHQGGSVPELKVTTSELPVLLLDGEELMGAKQNRVLNTSILLKENLTTAIPVSCTEQGRWAFTSPEFSDSDTIMAHKLRSQKLHSVTQSLHSSDSYDSDQGHIWLEINEMERQAKTKSTTGALRDIYAAKTKELDEYLPTFTYLSRQRGILVFINGQVAGFDLLSREAAYKTIHPKLVKSYALDALLQQTDQANEPSAAKAKTFLQEVTRCEESKFTSLGQGDDYRFEGADIVGSALVVEQHVIHTAFFRMDEDERISSMSGYIRRRSFRHHSRRS